MYAKFRYIVSLDDFLAQIDYDYLKQLNDPQILIAQIDQPLHNFKLLTGRDLLKLYLKSEAIRLKVHDEFIVKSALDHIWITYSALQNKFTLLADDVNKINLNKIRARDENLSRIIRLDVTQAVNSVFEDHFFNGVKDFNNNDNNVGFGCL
ncbi:unnamed protein product [Rhizophagus irregularis]|uniref:Uncharacterized protein n=1 Tax=Rhizophagus irregularis TaxID=588596 RepID=A0A2I1GTB5_9GLOM|nr:hypothetical protein RhiirA4_466032 [Rhizophagus irregularis]CAB4420069.1 unnamed protein product [Rhizophagus irregularis]